MLLLMLLLLLLAWRRQRARRRSPIGQCELGGLLAASEREERLRHPELRVCERRPIRERGAEVAERELRSVEQSTVAAGDCQHELRSSRVGEAAHVEDGRRRLGRGTWRCAWALCRRLALVGSGESLERTHQLG